jgi:hypothetical protein
MTTQCACGKTIGGLGRSPWANRGMCATCWSKRPPNYFWFHNLGAGLIAAYYENALLQIERQRAGLN